MSRLMMSDIARDVAGYRGLTVSELTTKTMRPRIAHAKHEFMWRAYKLPHASLLQIGRFLGMDHSSVIYGIRAHHERERQAREARS